MCKTCSCLQLRNSIMACKFDIAISNRWCINSIMYNGFSNKIKLKVKINNNRMINMYQWWFTYTNACAVLPFGHWTLPFCRQSLMLYKKSQTFLVILGSCIFFLLNKSDEYCFTCVLKNMCSGKHPRFYIKNFYRGIVHKVNLGIFIW